MLNTGDHSGRAARERPDDTGPRHAQFKLWTRAAELFILCGCLAYSLHSGLMITGPSRAIDSQCWYIAGKCWLSGRSPYAQPAWTSTWRDTFATDPLTFAYPPSLALLCMPLALLPCSAAMRAMDALNVVLLLTMLAILCSVCRNLPAPEGGRRMLAAGGLCCLASGVPATMFVGQLTFLGLIGAIGLMSRWLQRRGGWPSAMWCALGLVKPQLVVLPALFVFMAGHRRAVIIGVLLAVLAGIPGIWLAGPSFPWDFGTAAAAYTKHGSNLPANVPFPFASSGFGIAAWTTVGGVCVAAAGRFSRRIASDVHRAAIGALIPLAATGAFVPLHVYGLAVYGPLMSLALCLGGRFLLVVPAAFICSRPSNLVEFLTRVCGRPPGFLASNLLPLAIDATFLFVAVLCASRESARRANTGPTGVPE